MIEAGNDYSNEESIPENIYYGHGNLDLPASYDSDPHNWSYRGESTDGGPEIRIPRGKVIGGAKVSDLHTNFLINKGNANSLDLELLGEEIRSKVKKKYNINLDWELIRVGQFKKI